MTRKVVVFAVLVVVVVGGAATYLRPIAPVATGYAAKITCSGALMADRPVESASTDLPSNPLVPFLRTSVDEEAATVSTSLMGFWESTAWYTPGIGCTLAGDDPNFRPVTAAVPDQPDQPWPVGRLVDTEAARGSVGVDGEELDAAVQEAFTEQSDRLKNTRAVVVAHGGQLIAEQYASGFDADTELLGWSMGKSIGNAIIGRLARQDQLARDDANLRPEWADDLRAGIRITDLLRMQSGLVFDETYDPDTDATNMLFTPGSTADFAADKDLEANPGTWWSYSSGTSNILCDVAQEASGFGPEMARELVFDPLGMESAVVEADASGGLVCSSFPYATARDWARFGQWFLQGGMWDGEQLLPEDWIEYTTTAVELPTENPYGAHWWLNQGADGEVRMPSVPTDAYWASGNEGQQVVVVPSLDLVVVRLGFSSDYSGIDWGLEELLDGVIDALPATGGDDPPLVEDDDQAQVVTNAPTDPAATPSATASATPAG